MYCVYCHTFPNGKRYVGITSQKPESRWSNGRGYKTQLVYRAILKYGWDNIKHEILMSGLNETEAKEAEKKFISVWKTDDKRFGYNLTSGGDGNKNWNPSAEWRAKRSKAVSGEKNPMYGVRLSGELNPMYGVHRYGSQNPMYGKKQAEKTKELISEANSKRVICIDIDKKEITLYKSLTEAAKIYCTTKTTISRWCKLKAVPKQGNMLWGYCDV